MKTILAAVLGIVLLTGCDDYPGQREAPPQPPQIAPGYYLAVDREPLIHDIPSWELDLREGGQSREARVLRCYETCATRILPVHAGLNGLVINVPAENAEPSYDLAISATPDGLRLSYEVDGTFVQERLIKSREMPRPIRP